MSAMGQDSRVPWYGVPAPNTLRDTMDLQEAYLEFFGFGTVTSDELRKLAQIHY